MPPLMPPQRQSLDTAPKDQPVAPPPLGGRFTVVVFGASGDLAKKKTFPALFGLKRNGYLPARTQILGYARSQLQDDDFRQRVTEKIKFKNDGERALVEDFKQRCRYLSGGYDDRVAFEKLREAMVEAERAMAVGTGQQGDDAKLYRIFYLALPPDMFLPVAKMISTVLYDEGDVVHRVIVEKPFGRDLQTSNELAHDLGALFRESEIYRIDHYLGKEMVKNIMVLKFANIFFSAIWNRHYVKNVQITFKEPFGTEGRGGYFDEFGINHLLQVMAITAMERPVSLRAEDVRDEKVKVLKCIPPITMDNVLLGQYVASADGQKPGYLDDKTVPPGSNTPTYAATVLYIENERWSGVPWILKAGKALDEQKAEVRIQFDDVPGVPLFPDTARNELVIRVQPNEAVYMKLMNKRPGLGMQTTISELDLSYNTRYSDSHIPDAYEALILDVFKGNGSNFVRSDELEAAWKIFTPMLHHIEANKSTVQPEKYAYGSRGPASASDFIRRYGFIRHQQEYVWTPTSPTHAPNKL